MQRRFLRRYLGLLFLFALLLGILMSRSNAPSALQNVSYARAPNFRVYDSLFYPNKPQIGMTPIMVTGRGYWKGTDYSKPDEAACRKLAREVTAQKFSWFVVDIENWETDIRKVPKEEVRETIEKMRLVVRWMKSERPGLKVGVYGLPPIRDYWTPVQGKSDAIAAWKAANEFFKPLAQDVDFIAPSLYTFYNDVNGWKTYALANIAEAKRFGKPVLPFLWARYHPSNRLSKLQFISGDYWRTQLETVRNSGVEGVILWDWSGFSDPPQAIDTNADWWKETTAFVKS